MEAWRVCVFERERQAYLLDVFVRFVRVLGLNGEFSVLDEQNAGASFDRDVIRLVVQEELKLQDPLLQGICVIFKSLIIGRVFRPWAGGCGLEDCRIEPFFRCCAFKVKV
ncbi:hypothetical protein D3C75_1165070 [compost metagenome]